MAAGRVKVVILGHSFIRRLRDFVFATPDFYNLRLYPSHFSVEFRARGGLTIRQLANCSSLINFVDQDVCFLQIGSNDLCDASLPVKDIANAITSFASFLIITGKVKIVIIGQVLFRSSQVTDPWYNDRVTELNVLLESLCINSDTKLKFWHHHGFWSDPSMSHLSPDGVHLQNPRENARPMQKYAQSIKSAILHCARTFMLR
ncbi:uncharacterized protein LOC133200319 [Saccostrea echinata]|uniref:uncharacterized protein LOC133200319 n=1 Tax=Saccostrea echinata TaxID=191078 RepID=UPI002A8034FF|nr:uncharacterized protein LOC133200319 [Saccostrea echinata]